LPYFFFKDTMKITPTAIAGLLVIAPHVATDSRGFFYESFNHRAFHDATGLDLSFVQDSHSRSSQGVLRGMHFQTPQAQGKLLRVVHGAVQDVAVDLRSESPTQGRYVSTILTQDEHKLIWIPAGFAHGFLVLSETADVVYKATNYYAPQFEHCLAWNDRSVAIAWQSPVPPVLSVRDRSGLTLADALATVNMGCL
jgi:dTDP-4-dehydrorhamnose 3,5-epimerase